MPEVLEVRTGWREFARDPEQALNYLYCMLRAQRWVHRRVDRLSFIDSAVMVQNTSLDFTPPLAPPTFNLDSETAITVLPLMQVRKAPLVHFDLRDETGAPVPLLTARQSRTLASHGMLVLADRVLRKAGVEGGLSRDLQVQLVDGENPWYSPNGDPRVDLGLVDVTIDAGSQALDGFHAYADTQRRIVDLVAGGLAEGKEALKWFERPLGLATRVDVLTETLRDVLWASAPYRTYLRRLAEHYYVSPVMASPESAGRRRRVFKVQFERPRRRGSLENSSPKRGRSWLRRVGGPIVKRPLETLGMVATTIGHEANQAVDCESYHVEFVAPAGLKVIDVDWFIFPSGRSGRAGDADRVEGGGTSEEQAAESLSERRRRVLENRVLENRVLKDLSATPVVVAPDIRRQDVEPGRVNTAIHPVPLYYGLHLCWRLAASALSWISLALPVAAMAIFLHWVLAFGLTRPEDTPGWVPGWARPIADRVPASGALPASRGEKISEKISSVAEGSSGGQLAVALAQNRVALLLGIVAIAVALLVRNGEPPATKRLLVSPRLCVAGILALLMVAGAPLWVTSQTLEATWLAPASWFTLPISICLLVVIFGVWLTAVGPVRRVRRRVGFLAKRINTNYWRVFE